MKTTYFDDISLSDITLDNLPILKELKKQHHTFQPEICIERAHYITEFLRDKSSDTDCIETRYARAVSHFLSHKMPIFPDNNILIGTTTSKKLGAPVYPEFTGLTIWPELDLISTRKKNPLKLDNNDANELNSSIFPYWTNRTVLELVRKQFNNPTCLKLFERLVFYLAGKSGCISHTVPDYSLVLEKGIEHIVNHAELSEIKLRQKGKLTDVDRQSISFFQAVQIALKGLCAYADNLHAKAITLWKTEKLPEKKKYYKMLADICKTVPRKPAQSYHQAINALWITHIGIHAENINMAMSPGRLDQILYPYFIKDLREGVLTIEDAVNITGCLWLKLNDNTNLVPESAEDLFGGAGTVQAVTIGGIDKYGNDSVNELTYIILKVTELLCLKDPNVCARYNIEKNSNSYIHRVAEVIHTTKATPALYNDLAAIRTLENQGISTEDARNYAIIGCVELSTGGSSYDASASIILNLIAALEMTLYNGKRPVTGDEQIGPVTGDVSNFRTYNRFLNAFKKQVSWLINNAIELNELLGKAHQDMLPSPLLSACFDGPMQNGKDLIHGGARYNSSGSTHIGFADMIDSLNAIECAVFVEKKCSFKQLLEAMKNNFEGTRGLHAYLVNKTPKYGTDNHNASKNAEFVIDLLYSEYHTHKNYRGGFYRPAYWTMTNHAGLGRLCAALPSGRKANTVFASGITPSSQTSKNIAECLHAVSRLNVEHIPGGFALNIKYPSITSISDIERLAQTIKSYFRMGGLQIQFNILSYETLLDAKNNPDKYPGLLVRVSGYSAYFNDLNDAMKEEIITRTEYDIVSGKANKFPEKQKNTLTYA